MNAHNYCNSTVTNNFNQLPQKGYINIDEVLPSLYQAQAVLALLTNDSGDAENGFAACHEIVSNAIWAANDLISSALEKMSKC